MKRIFLVAALVLLSACQSIDSGRAAINPAADKMPEMSMFFVEVGKVYGNGPEISTDVAMYNVVVESDLFENVTFSNAYTPLKVYVRFRDTADLNQGVEQTKSLVSAFTLGLVPVTRQYRFEATFDLVLFDSRIKSYRYEIDKEGWVHSANIANMPYFVQRRAAESLTSQFLADLSNEDFSEQIAVMEKLAPQGI